MGFAQRCDAMGVVGGGVLSAGWQGRVLDQDESVMTGQDTL